jgi:hypothetical protein
MFDLHSAKSSIFLPESKKLLGTWLILKPTSLMNADSYLDLNSYVGMNNSPCLPYRLELE